MMLPFVLALYPVALCGSALAWLHSARNEAGMRWGLHALACASIVAFAFMTGPWAFSSFYLRYAAIGLYLLVAMLSFRRKGATQLRVLWWAFPAIALIVFVPLNMLALRAKIEPARAFDLKFPLTTGRYYVLQGGSSVVSNPFHSLGGSRFAVDIVKLNAAGNRAKGISPRRLGSYEIFGDTLHSPCSGVVLAVRDGLRDNIPGEIDIGHPEGNHVLLDCGGVQVLLAHLMRGSIRATAGGSLAVGQPLGKIGNSGNTSEPHLHVDAKREETEVPFKFEGRWLSINDVVAARR